MSSTNQFKKAFKGVDAAIKQGTARALNRALSSAKTKMVRALREDTGLKTEVVTTRTRAKKAKVNDLGVILGIAIKFAISLAKFDSKEKKVKARYKDGSVRERVGITAKIGKGARQLVSGAFPLVGRAGNAVLGRKGAFNSEGVYVDPNAPRYPTATLKTTVFTESAKANESGVRKHMVDTFDRIVAHEIDYAIQNKFSENK